MKKFNIGVYSIKGKRYIAGKDIGYIRFRLKDDLSDPVPMNVDRYSMYMRTPLELGYTTYTKAFEYDLDYYSTFMNDLELTLIDIYEIYLL